MKTLQLSNATARKLYPSAAPELKAVLEETFTKEFFSQKITDRITTILDVLEWHGIDPGEYAKSIRNLEDDEAALRTCKLIVKCLNEGWEPDWDNDKQPKYFIWWKRDKKAKFGLSYYFYFSYYQNTNAPSRLCFKDPSLAPHAATYFVEEFAQLINF